MSRPLLTMDSRILVERLWPRGLSKEKAAIDHWNKEIAPSPELRKWFGHDPARWAEFRKRDTAQSSTRTASFLRREAMDPFRTGDVRLRREGRVANSAMLLKEYLEGPT